MHSMSTLICALAICVLVPVGALAQSSSLAVYANVEPVSYIGSLPASVELLAPSNGQQIGLWYGQIPLTFGANEDQHLIVEFPGGKLTMGNGGTAMQNELQMAWAPGGGSYGTPVTIQNPSTWAVVQDFGPGEFLGDLVLIQDVTNDDSVGDYSGSITVYVDVGAWATS